MDRLVADKIAAKVLHMDRLDARKHSRELKEAEGRYYWDPARGGSAVIVAADSSFLWANSGVRPDVHVEAFVGGKRTDPSLFPNLAGA